MRINKFVAQATGMSRRSADKLIKNELIRINDTVADHGDNVTNNDEVRLAGKPIKLLKNTTILLNKPVGYVCSRNGQGSKTIYNLIPKKYHHLKPVGRLDKDSSGLLLLTNDGYLANKLTHPSFQKNKIYNVTLNKKLEDSAKKQINEGVALKDGVSKLHLTEKGSSLVVSMHEGRNRQIRRTFNQLGYEVTSLHRIQFGTYKLGHLNNGDFIEL